MKYVERTKYLERLRRLKGTPDIKIITGLRRAGKSELMAAFIREIEGADSKANVIYIDYYDLTFEHLKDYHALHDFASQNWQQGMTNYLFIDEVQLCPEFELAINSLHACYQSATILPPLNFAGLGFPVWAWHGAHLENQLKSLYTNFADTTYGDHQILLICIHLTFHICRCKCFFVPIFFL